MLAMPVIAAFAQTPPPAPAQAGRGGRGATVPQSTFANAYPQHAQADPESIARGRALYGVNCQFCHGSDARGGEGGPNLLRSEIVLHDDKGEAIAPIIQNGRMDQGMPKFPLSAAQCADVAAFIHSFRVAGYDESRNKPLSILTGDATAGQAYFQAKCATCHNVTADLKGIASRFADPRDLQQRFLMPGTGRGQRPVAPTTVTVTEKSGAKTEGRLVRIDDFIVTLVEADGTQRTFRRDGDVPTVELHDPLAAHRQLLRVYTDKDIHNLTSYLVTVK
jgi:mono/diheme cytochrome c family protein